VNSAPPRAPSACGERRRESGTEIHARQPDAGLPALEPRREGLRVGERGEQQRSLRRSPPVFTCRRSAREARVAIALRERAEHRLAVAPRSSGICLLVKVLAGEVGEHGQQRALAPAQVLGTSAPPSSPGSAPPAQLAARCCG
jgi:hypothetical protein